MLDSEVNDGLESTDMVFSGSGFESDGAWESIISLLSSSLFKVLMHVPEADCVMCSVRVTWGEELSSESSLANHVLISRYVSLSKA